ncbi:hypothetical protein OH491_27785 (plasmid) [Termitidicoccus mucosus]|uniref:hypothetical protein n=1 Tax=Termitidicoccus mucosus TaxID=1184151 RepID=UPI0031843CDB
MCRRGGYATDRAGRHFFKLTTSTTMPVKARIVYLYVPGVPTDRCADIANEYENTADATTTAAKFSAPSPIPLRMRIPD